MALTAAICQPTYLPWIGYFEQIAQVDVFVFLDTVQFEKQSWQNRNRIKGSDGNAFWLTVPVATHALGDPITDIFIAKEQRKWSAKHLQSIRSSLGRAPFFSEVFPRLESWLGGGHERLAELTIQGITQMAQLMGISTRFLRASELGAEGSRTHLVVDLLKKVGATRYRANAGSREYMEASRDVFADAGITYEYQNWEHPVYAQGGAGFLSHLAFPDCVCHVGWERAAQMVQRRNS